MVYLISLHYMWPVPGSEMVGFAKLRKREHENKTGGNHALIFSRVFHLRVIPTIWEPGTGYIICYTTLI